MRPLRALLADLRLLLAALALAGWVGPAATMSQAMAAPAAHADAAEHDHHGAAGGGHHGKTQAGHDPTACCAAACGPVVAPQPAAAETTAAALPVRLRPALDAFPPGIMPATLKPPPRPASC